ncbi:C39 family peptidase [Kitasatospora sp. NBC_00085]|uniref:papain-like cysteine protease family protein n=1 Tax=unclassified Kitasatospora TaxID=2633591 RepID=UPI00324EED2E
MSRHRRKSRRTAVVAAAATLLAGTIAFGLGVTAQADLVKGTVVGGQGNYSTVNERVLPSLSAQTTGQAQVGDRIPMICRTTGDTVESNNRWIWSGAFYIADAFIRENTGNLPVCSSTRPTSWTALDITMQKQVQDQWCWDASGLTIANYWGYTQYNQYDFCRLAAQGRWLDCNDKPATLEDMANGLSRIGFRNTGYGLSRNATFSEVSNEIAGGRPLAVRIGWRSGGGHMNVIYGYDSTSNMIAVGDPWPSTQTYTWWNFDTYVNNNSFQWTHSRTGIHA